jgi:RsiW-degrading membrane proteinase PrsW (M82 family)
MVFNLTNLVIIIINLILKVAWICSFRQDKYCTTNLCFVQSILLIGIAIVFVALLCSSFLIHKITHFEDCVCFCPHLEGWGCTS